jgi:glyoxylase-like metal-dependent hydrolase (beta-lactamase superfamily II)
VLDLRYFYKQENPRHGAVLTTCAYDRNWKTFDERTFDFCQGITLHHLPGHTDGLIGMQINMPEMGTYFFISDHCHVIENVSLNNHRVPYPSPDILHELLYETDQGTTD